ELDKYRQAQNGADAGALAVARKVYLSNNQATTSALCSTTTGSLGVGPREMLQHNGANSVTCSTKSQTAYGPTGADGFHSYGALSTRATEQNVNFLLSVADVKSHLGVNEATADLVNTGTPTSSGSVDLA